jgi:GNAT superfamily N-acetyltransferase
MIERLGAGEGERLRAIRLRALQDSPDAFATTYQEAAARPPESWERQVEELATFVATAGGRDLGLVRGAPHERIGDAGYLISMWVAPEARRQGIGSALIDALLQWATTRGLTRLILDVAERNAPAIALYGRKGFIPTGEVGTLPPPRDHVREIRLVMILGRVAG